MISENSGTFSPQIIHQKIGVSPIFSPSNLGCFPIFGNTQVEAHPAFAALLRTVEQQAEVIETKTKRGELELAASSLGQRSWGEGVDFGALDLLL